MKARRDIYQAIADPTRRQIIQILGHRPSNIKAISDHFKVSQQAISLQVKILTDCGLIKVKTEGRNRICEAQLDKLGEVALWLNQYRQHWESHLDSMENYITKIKEKRKNGKQ